MVVRVSARAATLTCTVATSSLLNRVNAHGNEAAVYHQLKDCVTLCRLGRGAARGWLCRSTRPYSISRFLWCWALHIVAYIRDQ